MLKGRLSFFLIATVFLYSCESQPDSQKTYLDLDSLVNFQVKNLLDAKASITKSASLGEMKDQSEFTPDSLGWATELDIVRQLDVINKPTNKDLYLVTDGEKDINSNLTTRSYKAKAELPVRSLKLYYFKELKNLKKIEAVFAEKNSLYSNERLIILGFDEVAGKTRLINYSISGLQKMILSDTVRFVIQSNIIF